MFVNIDQVPAGKSLYTIYVTTQPRGTARDDISADEVDALGPRQWLAEEATVYGGYGEGQALVPFLEEEYGPDYRVVGVVNQSDGFVVYDAFNAGHA